MIKYDEDNVLGSIETLTKTDIDYSIHYKTGETAKLTILNNHVFRFYMSPTGVFLDYPIPNNPTDIAKINAKNLKEYDTDAFHKSFVKNSEHRYIVHTEEIKIIFDKTAGTFNVHDKRLSKDVLKEQEPIHYNDEKTAQFLHQNKEEYFFGGGMQNGRFTHKGEIIHIENTNDWVDGGVASPSPFYWSSYGYGVLRNTWQPGLYNFGSEDPDITVAIHKEAHFDAFYFINPRPHLILSDYYELTGKPIFMPEYALYEAHLNTFNRDYWVEVSPHVHGAVQFEDGHFYKSYHPDQMDDKIGIQESLNGEKNNYQFSARAMIDRYKNNDMPLGWFIPNDGYGSGYGQTDSLEGDIENLKEFIEYAKKNGVEVALWTESNLEPKDPKHPKKGERDLSKEVAAGVVALKCDVAWIGEGYSFGLSAVEKATNLYVERVGHNLRPLIIMVDGWAGTQRYSGIWSGDQTGGKWEYIRFHIPTYIGAGLSGLPVVGSDMDGIYGGGDKEVNIRDYQWKTFTPLQLNMDGWGNIPKTPFSFDGEATAINRAYLKFKSMLLPYNYTIAHESHYGLPMVRAMFLEFPNEKPAHTKDSQYQYMWGPSLLVAPVYKNSKSIESQQVRSGVYLPDQKQVWTDLFTGQKFQGGKVYNNLKTPLWKIPVFVKDGAIVPFVNDNNNIREVKRDCRIISIYPNGETEFEIYEDDGKSAGYLGGQCAKTKVISFGPKSNKNGDINIYIRKTEGQYKNFIKKRTTLLRIMTAAKIEFVKAAINGESIRIERAQTEEEFEKIENSGYYYDQFFMMNPYLKQFNNDDELLQKCLLIKIEITDITKSDIQIKVASNTHEGNMTEKIFGSNDTTNLDLQAPSSLTTCENGIAPTSINLNWHKSKDASYYEIERDDVIFTNIIGETFLFEEFKCESEHTFRIRSVNKQGVSDWSDYITIKTATDPYKDTIKGITVKCNISCQPKQEVCKLTDCEMKSLWHTDWSLPDQADCRTGKIITLSFNLEGVYGIERIEYIPREDAGNGTFLKIQYRYSADGENWSNFSPVICWKHDETTKVMVLNEVKMQYFEINVLESVGGFGSGRNVLFYKKVQ